VRENRLKAMWRRGESAYGAWLTIPSSLTAEAIAHQGYDYVCIDMQHGAIEYGDAFPMLQAISTTDATPVVRVPWNEPGIIMKVLDAGAMGIIIPMVNSAGEARAAVSACRYFPEGARSYGPVRTTFYSGADYFQHANAEVACIPMIETKQAVERLDDILAVPGIDAVYVGPADLSITLGQPPAAGNRGAFEEARLRIAAACRERGITPGIHANPSLARKHVEAGYRMVTISLDLTLMVAGAAADISSVRDVKAGPPNLA
jgi:4-hydroxy-2-oxoheptanedioate aldolase